MELTDLFIENWRALEQLAQVGQLFTFFILFLTDALQTLRQVLDVLTEMFDCLQPILEITAIKRRKSNASRFTI